MIIRPWSDSFIAPARSALVLGALAFALSGLLASIHTTSAHSSEGLDLDSNQCEICAKLKGNPAESQSLVILPISWLIGPRPPDFPARVDIHGVIPVNTRAPPGFESVS